MTQEINSREKLRRQLILGDIWFPSKQKQGSIPLECIQYDVIMIIIGQHAFRLDKIGELDEITQFAPDANYYYKDKTSLFEVLESVVDIIRQMLLFHEIRNLNPLMSREEFDHKVEELNFQSEKLIRKLYRGEEQIWRNVKIVIGNIIVDLLQIGLYMENSSYVFVKNGKEYSLREILIDVQECIVEKSARSVALRIPNARW